MSPRSHSRRTKPGKRDAQRAASPRAQTNDSLKAGPRDRRANGSSDLARDVRCFATKFYTLQGNFDLVGNSMPVFFIQDGLKFPDLVHALKPRPQLPLPEEEDLTSMKEAVEAKQKSLASRQIACLR